MIRSFISLNKRYILLITYLLVSFFFMIVNSTSFLEKTKIFFFNMVSESQSFFSDVENSVGDFWYSIKKMRDIKKELQLSYEKIQLLEDASIEIDELRKENTKLKTLLEYKNSIKFDTFSATIVGKDPKNYFDTIIVDKGKKDGVEKNMPVIAYQNGESGVVGKTLEVGMNFSKILLLTDNDSYISALLQKSGYTGLIKGKGLKKHYVSFIYVEKNALVNFGDRVITSGQGGLYPKGINIGLVVDVDNSKSGFYYNEIKVLPIINFSKLEQVFIIQKHQSEELNKMMRP